jgi:hypothetical protein
VPIADAGAQDTGGRGTPQGGQGASVVRGAVVHADGRTPAPAILIELNDSRGDVVARVVTDLAGRFALPRPATGTYSVRALRVGYRPTVLDLVIGADAVAELRIVLGEQAVRIAAARVTTDDVCGIRSDSGKLVATAWEEARKAIALANASGGAMRFTSRLLNWRSTREPDGSGPVWQEYSTESTDNPRPFAAAPAESLMTRGFSRTASGGAVDYFGPDAETLVSDAFAANNCFRLVGQHPQRLAWIGIAFRPARRAGSAVEIAGTFWIDTATTALRLLEYRYTNVSVAMSRVGAGGRIAFDRLRSGEWLVRSWVIRLGTTLGGEPEGMTLRRTGPRSAPQLVPDSRIFAQISGGEVLAVDGDAGDALEPVIPTWRARFLANDSARLDGATVEFIEINDFAVADSAGAVALAPPPGRHTMLASTRVMRGLALPAIRRQVMVTPNDAATTTIPLPTDRALLVDRCGTDAEARGRAVVFGREIPPRPNVDEETTLAIEWMTDAARQGSVGRRWVDDSLAIARGEKPRNPGQTFTPDPIGRWFVCGVPRRSAVRVVTLSDGGSVARVMYGFLDDHARVVELTPAPPSGGQGLDVFNPGSSAFTRSAVRGIGETRPQRR